MTARSRRPVRTDRARGREFGGRINGGAENLGWRQAPGTREAVSRASGPLGAALDLIAQGRGELHEDGGDR